MVQIGDDNIRRPAAHRQHGTGSKRAVAIAEQDLQRTGQRETIRISLNDIEFAVVIEIAHGDTIGTSRGRRHDGQLKSSIAIAQQDRNRAGLVAIGGVIGIRHHNVKLAVAVEIAHG